MTREFALVNVTLDVFSALIDSGTGGSRVFDQIARRQRWALRGQALYRAWDREHKRLQHECAQWEPFTVLGRRALVQVLDEHLLRGDVDATMTELWAFLGDWPLWLDVARGVRELARAYRVGLLSNVDDAMLAAHPVGVAALRVGPGDHLAACPAVQAQPGPLPRGPQDRRSLFRARRRLRPRRPRRPCRPVSTPSASLTRPRHRPRRAATHPPGHRPG